MLSRLGIVICNVFRRTAPDPFVLAIFLTLLTAVLVLTIGGVNGAPPPSLVEVMDAWRVDSGLWKFLAFGMQMCLVLVTGHALASTRPVRAMIDRLARRPRNTAQAAALISIVAAVFGLVNWGLGLIVGALLAREVGRSLHRRGIRAHYPLLCAAGYMGLLVWHGGFSGSAPLSMTTLEGAAKVLPEEYVAQLGETGIPLSETILSPMNFFVTGGLLVLVPLLLAMFAPRDPDDILDISTYTNINSDRVVTADSPHARPTVPDRLDTSPIVVWLLAVPLLVAFIRYGYVTGGATDAVGFGRVIATLRGFNRLGLNEINIIMLALGLFLHGSPRAYMNAVTDGARGCAGIIVQFPLYAGIMAMMVVGGLVIKCADWFIAIGDDSTIPIMSFLSAGVVNMFVPSGGGQWGIQGPVALEAGLAAGIAPGKMIMAVAYGDQLTNMLQPFWALPLLGITGVRARDIVGYTALVMLAAGSWIALGLLFF